MTKTVKTALLAAMMLPLCTISFAQQDDVITKKETLSYSFNSETGEKTLDEKYVYTYEYDVDGRQIRETMMEYEWNAESNIWDFFYKEEIISSYDEDGRKTLDVEIGHHIDDESGQLEEGNKTENSYSYNENGLLTQEFVLKYDEDLEQAYEKEEYEYTYNEKGQKTSGSAKTFSWKDGEWKQDGIIDITNTYDENGNLTHTLELFYFGWDSEKNEWRLNEKEEYDYTYDENGRQTSMTIVYYYIPNSGIEAEWKYEYTYTYDENGKQRTVLEIFSDWVDGTWKAIYENSTTISYESDGSTVTPVGAVVSEKKNIKRSEGTYDLSGKRVRDGYKGMVIRNGKLEVIK